MAALVAACAVQVAPPPTDTDRPADFPEAFYRGLAPQDGPVYRVDPARSHVVVVVRRGGSLARLGHDHVVASHDVGGFVAPALGRADLYVPLERLTVDEPVLRAEVGLDSTPSATDIAGTRRNMLEKVLEAGRFPFATVTVARSSGDGPLMNRVELTLHGVTRVIEPQLQFRSTGKEVEATGRFAIDQSQFGIVPFSILGGAIAVQDRLDIAFKIVGVAPDASSNTPPRPR